MDMGDLAVVRLVGILWHVVGAQRPETGCSGPAIAHGNPPRSGHRTVAISSAGVVGTLLDHWQVIEGRVEAIGVLVLPEKEDRCEAILGRGW